MTLNINKKTGDKLTATEFNQVVDELNKKVDVVPGKGLSTNDYTDTDKKKLSGLSNYDDTTLKNRIRAVENKLETVTGSIISFAESEVGTLKYSGKDYPVFELSAELSGVPTTAGQSVDIVISDNPLGNELYLNVTCLSIATSGGFKTSTHEVSSVHVDNNMNTVVSINCKEAVTDLKKVILTVRYVKGMLTFDTFTLSIPKSELGIVSANDVTVTFPSLKYDKKFALSWTTDDALLCVYSYLCKYINKKYIDDVYNFHDGMTPTTGFTPARVLCGTDGCGNDVRFRVDSGWVSYNNNGSDGIHSDSYPYVRWSEMVTFFDFFNTAMNHGGGDQTKPLESIEMCGKRLDEKTGYFPFLLLVPGGTTGYQQVAEALDYIYHYHDKNNLNYSVDSLTRESFMEKHGLLGRKTYDGMTYDELRAYIDTQAARNDHPYTYLGGHVVADANEQIKWTDSVKPFFDYLHDTYGKGGNDSIWFAGPAEVYEYLFTRLYSVVNKKINGNNLEIKVKVARLPLFYQREISLLVKKTTSINSNVSTLTVNEEVIRLSHGLKDGNLLINLNYNPRLLELAEKYTSKYKTSSLEVDKDDALYFANLLNDDLKAPFLARINAGDMAPVLNSITVNSGASTTHVPTVTLSLDVTGTISAYRASESADLSGLSWVEGTSKIIAFNLSSPPGIKTIHVQVKNSFGESEIKSSSITLVERPAETHVVTASSNDTSRGAVTPETLEVEDGGDATVMAMATGDNVIEGWMGADSSTGVGEKTGTATVTNVREDRHVTCNFQKPSGGSGKKILVFNASTSQNSITTLPDGRKGNVIRVLAATSYDGVDLVDVDGETIGRRVFSGLPDGLVDVKYLGNTSPVLSGNTGVYPDSLISNLGGVHTPGIYPGSRGLFRHDGLAVGTYKVRLLVSSSTAWPGERLESMTFSCNGVTVTVPSGFPVQNNNSVFLGIDNIPVGADGILDLYLGSTITYTTTGFTMMEIEKIS